MWWKRGYLRIQKVNICRLHRKAKVANLSKISLYKYRNAPTHTGPRNYLYYGHDFVLSIV